MHRSARILLPFGMSTHSFAQRCWLRRFPTRALLVRSYYRIVRFFPLRCRCGCTVVFTSSPTASTVASSNLYTHTLCPRRPHSAGTVSFHTFFFFCFLLFLLLRPLCQLMHPPTALPECSAGLPPNQDSSVRTHPLAHTFSRLSCFDPCYCYCFSPSPSSSFIYFFENSPNTLARRDSRSWHFFPTRDPRSTWTRHPRGLAKPTWAAAAVESLYFLASALAETPVTAAVSRFRLFCDNMLHKSCKVSPARLGVAYFSFLSVTALESRLRRRRRRRWLEVFVATHRCRRTTAKW